MTKRIKWLDFGKGITILSVLLLHNTLFMMSMTHSVELRIILDFLEIFVMPCFFAISGYLYRPIKSIHDYFILIYKKSASFVIPYIVFTLILLIKRCAMNIHRGISFNYRVIDNIFFPQGYLWFLYVLFFIFLIVGLMDLLHIKMITQFVVYILLLFLQMQFSSPWSFDLYGCNIVKGLFGYIICFYIGYIIKILLKNNTSVYHYFHNKILLIILSSVYIILNILMINKYGVYSYAMNDMIIYKDVVIKLFSIIVFFDIFINFNHNKFFNYFDNYGKGTLVIYLIHFPILVVCIAFIKRIISLMGLSLTKPIVALITCVLVMLFVWYISIFTLYLAKKIKLVNFIFYPRKYINKLVIKTRWGRWLLN